jgi:Zn-dependent protease
MNLDVMLIVFQVIVLIFAFSVHEAAHAYAAFRLGDATAYMLGRVTLNPIKHIDPMGSVVMPIVALISGFPLLGWAKPCPVTTRNFKKIKRDDIITTAAGPISNLLIATVALILLVILKHLHGVGSDAVFAAMDVARHIPTDLIGLPTLFPLALLLYYSILTNVLLFCFNLIPLPPLDGSRILHYYLPYGVQQAMDRFGNYGIILVFLFAGRLMMPIYRPLLGIFDSLLLSL